MKEVYKKISNIKDIGDGLFAGEDIKKDSYICEFKGKKINHSQVSDSWSVIYFFDKYRTCIQCDKTNLASYCNDIITFKKDRNMLKDIVDGKPIYESYNNLSPNCYILQDDKKIRAWLVATRDIKKDEEIFTHYGIHYWLATELKIPEINKYCKLPSNFFHTKSFREYVKIFYPDVIKIDPKIINNQYVVSLETKDGAGYVFDLNLYMKENRIIKIKDNTLYN